ncbi:MAG: type II secretion system GspH family protein [Lentisphaerales bacterium]|nr:type II secretion system GspH family protein [Lentisphaerales bacterium]
MKNIKNTKQSFTLIELLVVIAIIGILTSILLPSLSEARLKTKRALCLSNLKQLNIAQTAYSSDNDGRLANSSFGTDWQTTTSASLHVWNKNTVDPFVETYLDGNIQAFLCPLQNVDENFFEFVNNSYQRLTSYMSATNEGLSNTLSAGTHFWKKDGKNYHINRFSTVEDSSQFLFADFIRFNPYKSEWNVADKNFQRNGKPEGGNEMQVNGAARWRTFKAKTLNYQHGSWPYYWTDDDR